MTYSSKFLQSKGQIATIQRTPTVTTKASLKRSTKAVRDPGIRDSSWEGLVLPDSNLAGGEIFYIDTDKYLVQSANFDVASGAITFFAVKVNAVVTPLRRTEDLDEDYNMTVEWKWTPTATTIDAFGQVVTYALRQYDPGLLESSRYIFYLPSSYGVQVLDRLVLNGENLMVNAIDPLMLEGVVRVQAGTDTRE
jgi:hypothetical protein